MPNAERADLVGFYATEDESTRLSSREGRVEFVRTQTMLRRLLETGSQVLDVGGADGVHAEWLVHDGHDVEILDVVPTHIERATERGFVARKGDACELPYPDATFDAVLLLGPLYHLVDASDRAQALTEAHRVLRPSGLIAAAAVTRVAVALDYLRKGRFDAPAAQAVAAQIVVNGHDDTGFGAGIFYFHTVEELRRELLDTGFADVTVRGIEGPAWPLVAPDCGPDDPRIDQVTAIAEMVDGDEALAGASAHILAAGRS